MHTISCFLFAIFSLAFLLTVRAELDGLTIDLIHRDSPLSPVYNHSKTPSELLTEAFLRSVSRTRLFQASHADQKGVVSDVIPNGGDYLMKISVGTPPTEAYAVADTGSDLIWVQCNPCEDCYPQDQPIFDSSKSSTYKELPCSSEPCQALPPNYFACGSSNECSYRYSYGDRSSTEGTLSTETLTFDSGNGPGTAFPNSVFGCGKKNGGKFNSKTSGIVGLGQGPLSLVSQLATDGGNKFSYCLAPTSSGSTSKLRFGREATIAGNKKVSTPIVTGTLKTFYLLTLEGISVGDRTIQSGQSEGNIIIDSGTTLTMLEPNLYSSLESTIQEAIGVQPVQESIEGLNLCYEQNSVSFPPLVFHFTGADLSLSPENSFISANGLSCLTIVPGENVSIFGNLAQVNYQVEYDLDAKLVSFAPTDCTKQ